jgi:hypothetical protein
MDIAIDQSALVNMRLVLRIRGKKHLKPRDLRICKREIVSIYQVSTAADHDSRRHINIITFLE